ncbi:hypothetical protein B8W72_02075 [Pseudomonas putida]|uniref:Uncharacterized protein n=1 Tax=Pseudomonas putida TaxID=303 RepID=A0A1Y3LJN1_PSEPU|nr:hypothetical protein B8W72_02075 [Pseudomonas putida]
MRWHWLRRPPPSKSFGAALQPIRGTRPLLQGNAISCRSGLVPRKGRKAAPKIQKSTLTPRLTPCCVNSSLLRQL